LAAKQAAAEVEEEARIFLKRKNALKKNIINN